MKNLLLNLTKNLFFKVLLIGIISILLIGMKTLTAQVSFLQTSDADFLKGSFNNAVVGSNNVYLQNSASDVGTWLTTTVLPQTLCGHKTVSWNDRYVYMVGGYNNTSYVNTVYVATIQSGGITGWTALNPLPVALRDAAVVIGTNTIYVMGGRDASQVYNSIYYASINTDGTIGAWQTSSVTLPANLWGHTATYVMGYIYIVGGSSSMTENTALNTVYFTKVNALNTLSSFTSGTNLGVARNRHSTITYNNKLYVMGGYDNSGTKSNSVYIATPALNGTTGVWTSGTNLPVAISNHSAVANNGIISVLAGAVGATLSNTVYYANADAGALSWVLSPNIMYDFTKDGSAFAGNGLIFYTGGTNLSGTPILNCRFALMTMTANFTNHGTFVSTPYYELGSNRLIDSITFTKAFTAPANIQVSYRTAGTDGIWSDWATLLSSSPIAINQTKQYLQYALILTGSTTFNATFNEMRLYTPGTQLSGNLNSFTTFTKALSPYWATTDISFTGGTHTFQAGATILFLPNTGLTISAANIICNGTAVDSVRFTYFTNEIGKWNGIYFDENSDAGVSSQFNYTVISNAGNGSRNANLSCYATSEPLINNCSFRDAEGYGLVLNSAHLTIQNSTFKGNTESGLYLNNSNPTLNSNTISYNGFAGMYITSASSLPNYTNTAINNNTYALYYSTSNITLTKHLGSLTLTNNTYNGICLPGGYLTDNNRWNSLAFPIFILDNLYIGKYASICRLTIEPGNTVKLAVTKMIQIGFYSGYHYAGELYALGTVDSSITFTSTNGLSGGWEGIYFEDRSDWYGAASVMDYCVIEKGNAYNIYSENTNQPSINHCTIKNAAQDGIKFYGAYNTVINSTFQNNGRYPVYYSEPHTSPTLSGNTYTGNTINLIGYCGGGLTESRTFQNDGVGYHILDNILVGKYNNISRLTIQKGVTLNFANGKGIQIGRWVDYHYGGELYAIGTVDSLITFRPYSGVAGDWNGIYFEDRSDWSGATNQLKYCKIEKANAFNVYVENTSSVIIDSCIISNAVTDGLKLYGAYGSYTNCTFSNNGRYPVYYTEWSSQPVHKNNIYTGNGVNLIALSGGTYTENRSITKDGTEYLVLDNIIIGIYNGVRRLTVNKGITLNFSTGKGIKVGQWVDYFHGGELYAVGNADSMITFKPYSGIAGDWNGIYFDDRSDWSGATNQLIYCKIEKANAYNVYFENTGSVTLDHCIISDAITDGLRLYGGYGSYTNCTFSNNGRYPVYYTEWSSQPTHYNNIFIGNDTNLIALSGGTYSESRSITKDGTEYLVLDNIQIGVYNGVRRLTIDKGITLNFASGKNIQVGFWSGYYYGGELYAVGNADSLITFRPFSGTIGDWNGIYFDPRSNWGGATSNLTYCNIEKGNTYNVYTESTAQPTINHCKFSLSNGNGLVISNSNLNIRNSYFTNNATNGIYFDGTGTATLGNADTLSCNLYNNGTYAIYNNSTADINARYNYWGTSDSTMITLKIYDKGDNSAKGRVYFTPFAQLPFLLTSTTLMSGSIKYANTGANPMKNASMVIKNFSDAVIASTTSNTSGIYSFSAFPSGNYKMTITPTAPWGGVNSTDALNVLNHFAQINLLTGLNLAAADVNKSYTINGTDALFIMKRYSALITSFPSGDYLYHSDTIITNGNQLTNNIKMICYGDVNASNAPAKKSTSSIGLIYESSLIANSFDEFDFPVRLKSGMQVAAISLGFYFPKQYIEVIGARLANGNTGFPWSANEGLFKMGWCDLNTLNIINDDIVVILRMRAKDISGLTSGIELELFEESEFADALAIPNDLEVVSIPTILNTTLGIQLNNHISGLSVYPNPVKGKSIISFTIDNPANISISLVDIVGHELVNIISGDYVKGNHKIELNSSGLKPGIYFLKLTNTNNGQTMTEMIKLVIS